MRGGGRVMGRDVMYDHSPGCLSRGTGRVTSATDVERSFSLSLSLLRKQHPIDSPDSILLCYDDIPIRPRIRIRV